jgi:hypothetical protein
MMYGSLAGINLQVSMFYLSQKAKSFLSKNRAHHASLNLSGEDSEVGLGRSSISRLIRHARSSHRSHKREIGNQPSPLETTRGSGTPLWEKILSF